MAKIKCQICKETLNSQDNFVFEFTNRRGNLDKKHGHKQCIEDWYKIYSYVKPKKNKVILPRPKKCQVCGILVDAEYIFTSQYINNRGNTSLKVGHKSCVNKWMDEYNTRNSVNELLKDILDIPKIPDTFFSNLNGLHKSYSWSTIKKTIEEKQVAISSNFDKGWRYIFAIINNSIAQVYKSERKQAEQIMSEPTFNTIFDIGSLKGRQLDNTDYSRILDDD